MSRPIIFSLWFLLAMLGASRAKAGAVTVPHGTVTVVAEDQSVSPGHPFHLGLHFELEKGWHIYWLNPGDSGQPPHVVWNLPPGISAGDIKWPAPERLGSSSIVDFGYTDEVTLLVPLSASTSVATQQPLKIDGQLRVLVCREICVPGKAELSLAIPIKPGAATPDAQSQEWFAEARKSIPRPAPAAWKFRVTDQKDDFALHAAIGREVAQATFFPLEESEVDNAASQTITPLAQGFQMKLKKSDQLLKPITHLKGVLELSPGHAFTIDAVVVRSGTAH